MASSSDPPTSYPYSSSSSFHAHPPDTHRHGQSGHAGSSVTSFSTFATSNQQTASTAAPSTTSTANVPPPLFVGARDGPRDLLSRRTAAFVHLKAVITGRQLHGGIVQLSRKDFAAMWDPEKTKKRSYRHLALGLAISPFLEVQSATDFGRGVLTALNDVEALPDTVGNSSGGLSSGALVTLGFGGMPSGNGPEKKGVRNLFSNKLRHSKKGTFSDAFPTADSISSSTGAGSSSAAMASTSSDGLAGFALPFAPDFIQTLITLLDVLIEVYSKLLLFVAPTPQYVQRTGAQVSSRTGDHSGSPAGGGHRPHPSTSSLSGFSPSVAMAVSSSRSTYVPMSTTSSAQSQNSNIAPPQSGTNSEDGREAYPGGDQSVYARSTSGAIQPSIVELINKIDSKVKKIIAPITKDLDTLSRHIIKEELAALESGNSRPPQASPASASRLASFSKYGGGEAGAGGGSMGSIGSWTGLPQPPPSVPGLPVGTGEEDGLAPYTPIGGSFFRTSAGETRLGQQDTSVADWQSQR